MNTDLRINEWLTLLNLANYDHAVSIAERMLEAGKRIPELSGIDSRSGLLSEQDEVHLPDIRPSDTLPHR